jgi:hypothetical protein
VRLTARSPAAAAALALALLLAGTAAAATVHDVPLPRGARSQAEDLFVSAQTFRKSVDHFRHWLDRQGLAHEAIPVYRYRGVEVARFLSRDPRSRWLAIHVFRRQGRTMIAVLPRPATIDPANSPRPP